MTLDNDVTNFLNNNNTLNNIISNNNLLGTFKDCVLKAVENAAGYVIKSMPVTDHVKDVLLDVKNSFRSKEITELLNSVVIFALFIVYSLYSSLNLLMLSACF